jgi:hypothetical protein
VGDLTHANTLRITLTRHVSLPAQPQLQDWFFAEVERQVDTDGPDYCWTTDANRVPEPRSYESAEACLKATVSVLREYFEIRD